MMYVHKFTYFRDVLDMDIIADALINATSHPIVDGKSAKQKNAFDCGVFCMANIENFALYNLQLPITQSMMPLYRCRYLYQLYEQAIATGILS